MKIIAFNLLLCVRECESLVLVMVFSLTEINAEDLLIFFVWVLFMIHIYFFKSDNIFHFNINILLLNPWIKPFNWNQNLFCSIIRIALYSIGDGLSVIAYVDKISLSFDYHFQDKLLILIYVLRSVNYAVNIMSMVLTQAFFKEKMSKP